MAKFRPRVEALEDRTLMSNIVWVNRLTPTDRFTPRERAVVDRSIQIWENLIEDFNSQTNELHLTITGGSRTRVNLGGQTLGVGTRNFGPLATIFGTPQGSVVLDANPGGWYIDPRPANDTEFRTKHTKYHRSGGPPGSDMLSVLLHEIGHVLGLPHFGDRNDLMNAVGITGHRYLPTPRDVKWIADNMGVTVKPLLAPLTPKVSFVPEVFDGDNEDVPTKVINVVLSAVPTAPVTVSYAVSGGTATPGADFNLPSGTLTFAPGEFKKTITLSIVDDAVVDSNFSETVQVSLFGAVNATVWAPFGIFGYEIWDNDF